MFVAEWLGASHQINVASLILASAEHFSSSFLSIYIRCNHGLNGIIRYKSFDLLLLYYFEILQKTTSNYMHPRRCPSKITTTNETFSIYLLY